MSQSVQMKLDEYSRSLHQQLSYLVAFARKMNELDLAGCIFQEARGAQDAGWSTTITAHQVFNELRLLGDREGPLQTSEFRVILLLYAQLSEAGGVYEGLRNLIGVVQLKPYLLWPFQHLVRVRERPKRILGPNANATFKDLASAASDIGMTTLSVLLENTFRDDIRNGIAHADYIIWSDGLRLRNRNGGRVNKIEFDDALEAVNRGCAFFELLHFQNDSIAKSFAPAKNIVGRFSDNPPMCWTVECDPKSGSFSISGTSPGCQTTPEFERQSKINAKLGGRILALYTTNWESSAEGLFAYISSLGFEAQIIVLHETDYESLKTEITEFRLWDSRSALDEESNMLLVSPWGFTWLRSNDDFDRVLPAQETTLEFVKASE
jgi:hypothetical protein